jgi:hypothetical protein
LESSSTTEEKKETVDGIAGTCKPMTEKFKNNPTYHKF